MNKPFLFLILMALSAAQAMEERESVRNLGNLTPELQVQNPSLVESTNEQFLDAIKQGDMDLANTFIEEGIDLGANKRAVNDFFSAVSNQNIDLVKFFIKAHIDIEAPDFLGYSALQRAAMGRDSRFRLKDLEIAKLLIEAKADVNAGYLKPLALAAHAHFPEMVKLLLASGANDKSISLAAANTQSNEIKELLRQHGAQI